MRIITDKAEIRRNFAALLHDESRYTLGVPQRLYFPAGTEDVKAIVRESGMSRVPLTAIGGKTGITGGSTPPEDCYAVVFSEQKAIKKLEQPAEDRYVLYCEPGITLSEIAAFLEAPQQWPYPVPGAAALPEAGRWFYPPDPTEMSAQLGGTVATNASGARSFHYGATRNHIAALSIVLADGDTLTLRRELNGQGGLRPEAGLFTVHTDQGRSFTFREMGYQSKMFKNAAGYYARSNMELIDLFIGSEGTLGFFTEVGIILQPRPEIAAGLSFFSTHQEAFSLAEQLRTQARQGQLPVVALEYFDKSASLLVQAHKQGLGLPDINPARPYGLYWELKNTAGEPFAERWEDWERLLKAHGSSLDDTWSGLEVNEQATLKSFRHAVPELVNRQITEYKKHYPGIRKIGTDTVLPAASFTPTMNSFFDLIAASGLEYVIFGHIGDCHLHINFIPRNAREWESALELYDELMQSTLAEGGSVSGEHGIGKLKTKYLPLLYGAAAYEEMLRIKNTFDPAWLFNRGTLFPYPSGPMAQPSD